MKIKDLIESDDLTNSFSEKYNNNNKKTIKM